MVGGSKFLMWRFHASNNVHFERAASWIMVQARHAGEEGKKLPILSAEADHGNIKCSKKGLITFW